MNETPDSKNQNRPVKIHWVKLVITVIVVFALSVLLYWLLKHFIEPRFSLSNIVWIAYSALFGITFLINLSFIPLPFAVSLMIAAAAKYNPVMIALVCSVGACLGEMSGYYVGLLGKKVALANETRGYQIVRKWIDKYGFWAIVFISFQPVLPVEVGGIVAGAAKMPVAKFLPALWTGKFPKYIILIYAGLGIIHFLPFLKT
ncbi:MAG: YqaA family protein [Dehalococcoidales bacterium]